MIYLDNAATSFPKPEPVYQALDRFARTQLANPGRSSHRMAKEAERTMQQAQTLARDRKTEASARAYFDAADLFAANGGIDILTLIQWRDLYAWLEETVDACKDTANVISEIVVKGS